MLDCYMNHIRNGMIIKKREKNIQLRFLFDCKCFRNIQKILLTNDLTENVIQEVLEKNADMIISYHPPIFEKLKRITQSSWKERLISICIENRIAIYSPHTAWDSVPGGVNDWLVKAFPISESRSIVPHKTIPDIGAGRIITIKGDLNLKGTIENIKNHTGLKHLHVAFAVGHNLDSSIKTVAICAGSGNSLLKHAKADLYLTGEMSHHDLLNANHNGTNVILCNHSNSERGFLKEFANVFNGMLNNSIEILVSESDADPLSTY